jgi:hypothetical protein
MVTNVFVTESLRGVAMRAAGGELDGFPLVQLRCGANVGVNIDHHQVLQPRVESFVEPI